MDINEIAVRIRRFSDKQPEEIDWKEVEFLLDELLPVAREYIESVEKFLIK